MNALVAFLFSYLLVYLFNLNIANELIGIYTGSSKSPTFLEDLPGALLTAMIIAGGSAAVNRIFQSFGFRPTSAQEQPKKPEPNQREAWIAVTLRVRRRRIGSFVISYEIKAAFRKLPDTLVPGADYEIAVQGYDGEGNKLGLAKCGPFAIVPRAIIDIELKV